MWSKIKKIFSSKKESFDYNTPQENVIDTQNGGLDTHTEVVSIENETTMSTNTANNNLQPLPTGLVLGDALTMLIYEQGVDFVLSGNIYNAIADYGAFQNDRARKTIFKSMESEGIIHELLTLNANDNIDNKILKYTQTLTSNFGYDPYTVNTVLCEILYGINAITENDCKSRIRNFAQSDNVGKSLALLDQVATPIREVASTTQPYNPSQGYKYPPINVLPINNQTMDYDSELEDGRKQIEWVLASQGITVNSIKGIYGPRVSMYEIDIDPRKLSKVNRYEKEILSALSPIGGRILNPIPGKMVLGIELPNSVEYELCLRDVLDSPEFTNVQYELPIVFGIDSMGNAIVKDLTKLSHLLICGEMQQGKTSLVRQILASLLVKKTFEEVKFTLIDTCSLDLQNFKGLCGYWMAQGADDYDSSVVYGSEDGMKVIHEYLIEIACRKVLFENAKVSNIKEYNEKFCNRMLDPSKGHRYMPYLILVCDEIAPLVSSNAKEFETIISSLISRATNMGIHCIFTTKYTSSEILTPFLRASFPIRVSFRIHLPNESKLITGNNVATTLLSNGDAVILENGLINRFQCPKCDSEDIQPLIDECYRFCQLDLPYLLPDDVIDLNPQPRVSYDPLLEEAARFLVSAGSTASTSTLQRRYYIGYNRAGKIMDELESIGVLSKATGSTPRNVLVDIITLESIIASIQ